MAIKKIIFITIISSFWLVSENCNRHCLIASGTTISLTGGTTLFTPIKDSIKIGDTLFLNVAVPDRLNYSYTNQLIDFSNANNMKADVRFMALKSVQNVYPALDSFSLTEQAGSFSINPLLPNASVAISFNAQASMYFFSVRCIAKKKGIYMIIVSDIPYANKKCDYASISIVSKSSDSHLHYLKDIYYGGGPMDPVDSTHSYWFKVY